MPSTVSQKLQDYYRKKGYVRYYDSRTGTYRYKPRGTYYAPGMPSSVRQQIKDQQRKPKTDYDGLVPQTMRTPKPGVKVATQTTTGKYAEFRNQDLGKFKPMTEQEMNDWIAKKAPKDSPFQGNAKIFLDASKASGLDPRYILAHAALESGWGKSRISQDKHNYFGIGAFDSSPYSSAYTFGGDDKSGLAAGIIEGAKWISDHYYNGKYGQRSLYSMRWNDGVHQYATDQGWDTKIASIMSSAPQ